MPFKLNPLTGELDYYEAATATSVGGTDTKVNILASTRPVGETWVATDTDEEYTSLGGGAWIVAPFPLLTSLANPDAGAETWNNRLGYGEDYITNKSLNNVNFGANASTTEGGTWVDKSADPYLFRIYLNGAERTIMVDFSNALGYLVHYPFDADEAVEVNTGNSVEVGMNGLPIMQEYEVDAGAYPAMRILNGGTY